MVVHICCSVDSHYFLQKLQEDYPNEEFIGFFYDPNIHPYSEYRLRLFDVQHSCKLLGISLIEGEYDLSNWLNQVKGLENEPEKGGRCTVCFDKRLSVSAKKATELKHNKFTTTLLMSPKKSQDKLQFLGDKLAKEFELEFIFKDYRVKNGIELQGKEVKQNSLYRQNYCGCLYGLTAQRIQQDKFLDEMISPINQQILPASIEERLEIYQYRNKLHQNNSLYKIIKERFLNYRLLSGKVMISKQVIDSYFLPYSTLKNKKTNAKVEYTIDNIAYLNRDEVKIIDLKYFNQLADKIYQTIQELNYHPLKFQDEVNLRKKLINNDFDLSCIIVLKTIPATKIEIILDSKVYDDVREKVILI